jgi:hypothetical protein
MITLALLPVRLRRSWSHSIGNGAAAAEKLGDIWRHARVKPICTNLVAIAL